MWSPAYHLDIPIRTSQMTVRKVHLFLKYSLDIPNVITNRIQAPEVSEHLISIGVLTSPEVSTAFPALERNGPEERSKRDLCCYLRRNLRGTLPPVTTLATTPQSRTSFTMADFAAPTPQLVVLKGTIDGYLTRDINNTETFVSKDSKFRTFPKDPGHPDETGRAQAYCFYSHRLLERKNYSYSCMICGRSTQCP